MPRYTRLSNLPTPRMGSENSKMVEDAFAAFDKDGNGRLSPAEFE